MNKKTKQVASGILITSIIGTTTFLIIDPYKMFDKKEIEKSETISDKNKESEKDTKRQENSEVAKITNIKDGTYTGTSKGFGGNINVNVTIKNNKIQNIEVVSHSETPEYYEKGRTIISSILKENSVDIDAVSGATFTSNGIKNAVSDALRKAGFSMQSNNDNLDKATTTNKTSTISNPLNYKIINTVDTIDAKQYSLKNGEFIGHAIGFGGPIRVKVIIKDGKLIDVLILSHQDNNTLFNKASSVIIKILNEQSTVGIDTVTGATYSSKGIISAINAAVQESIKQNNVIVTDKRFVEPENDKNESPDSIVPENDKGGSPDSIVPEKDKDESAKSVLKSKLKDLINKKVHLKDKTYETITQYNNKKANAERIVEKANVELDELDKTVNELQAAIDGLKTSILRPEEIYEVNINFSNKGNESNLINNMIEKAEVKLNEQGKIDVTFAFKPKNSKGSFLNDASKFIIKDGENIQILTPEIKNGLETFNFTLSKEADSNEVEVFIPGDILSGNSSDAFHILWKSLRLSGATAPDTNPLKPGNDYTVFLDIRNYNTPDSPSMANSFLKKPSTISVDRKGVAKLTLHMTEQFDNSRIYTDKALSNSLVVQSNSSYAITFTLPAYDKEGWLWGTSYITAMKMDVKFGLKIDWATLNNVKGKTETLSKEGLVSGTMGSINRNYAILVNVLLDRESNLFKDLIVNQEGHDIDSYYLDKATKGFLDKIKNKPVALGTIQNIDSISGATLSSNGIKAALIAAIKERNEEQNKFFADFITTGKGRLEGETVFSITKNKTWKQLEFEVPTPIAEEGYFFDRWSPKLPTDDEIFTEDKTYTAIFIKNADKSELNAVIATEVDKTNRSPNMVAIYEEKLNAATAVAANGKAKQVEVDKAKQDLETIISILKTNLEYGKIYEVSAKFTDLKYEIKAFKNVLQKIEVKINEHNKLEITMIFKLKPGFSFTKKGIFKIKIDGKNKTITPEVKGDLEIFNFTLPDYKKKYGVMIKIPSRSLFGGLATSFEILWDTIKPIEVVANE